MMDTDDSLPPALSPCDNVRRTCRLIMSDPDRTVSIDFMALKELASSIHSKIAMGTTWAEWDVEGWHYTAKNYKGSNENRQERIALYVLALDAINFCFWPSPSDKNNSLEYDHLATALTRLAEQDDNDDGMENYVFSPRSLATMTESQFVELICRYLDEKHHLPNAGERVRLWNEVGQGLLQHYNGSAVEMIKSANNNAPRLVQLLISTFPGFRDESLHESKWVCFYKRAQIAVGDLQAALNLQLKEMDKLTMFADYRVPQLLRHVGVLCYKSELANLVDSQQEIAANHSNELYIRAATVVAVEELVQEVKKLCENDQDLQSKITDVAMDWHLWQVGEELHSQSQMKPHHKTKTIFY